MISAKISGKTYILLFKKVINLPVLIGGFKMILLPALGPTHFMPSTIFTIQGVLFMVFQVRIYLSIITRNIYRIFCVHISRKIS